MISVRCFVCEDELEEPGALYFTPPGKDDKSKKLHICKACDRDVRKTFAKIRLAVKLARQPISLRQILRRGNADG